MTKPGPQGGDDPLVVGEVPPPAVPPVPAYELSELLEPVPGYGDLDVETPTYDALAREPLLTAVPEPETGSGPLVAVSAFAAKNPAGFLGAALAVGWVLGRLFSSDDDES